MQRVVCVGNSLCHDDGVASAVGQLLESHATMLGSFEVVHVAEIGLACLDAFLGVEHVVVVDAVVTGNPPGDCRVLANLEFTPRATCSIGHAVTLASLLELAAQLAPKDRAPRVTVIGIEAENLEPFGTTLSPSVLAAVPQAVELVLLVLGV
jgi:hydrogenase maturation protease